jgi:S-adenosylmethionine:tRNA ribosyltransferase-isomerase
MLVSDFDYELPPELIAQVPTEPRDSARLLVFERQTGQITHRHVYDLPNLIPPATVIVANNSKVRPSRLWGRRGSREVEILLLERTTAGYTCLLGGAGAKPGTRLTLFGQKAGLTQLPFDAVVLAVLPGHGMTTHEIRFNGDVELYAEVPLPPYISSRASEPERYQTTFAKDIGSAAAPTAGLHFTPELIHRLVSDGNSWAEVTLHVGLGTFLPLRKDVVTDNRLHVEQCHVSPEVARLVNSERPVLAIGTTSARTLESHVRDSIIVPGWKETELFIYPGYHFTAFDLLLTNFHLPKSSLLLLVAAFIGGENSRETLLRIYAEAIEEQYRFFSFGDAMLIV